jgi:hypothetical protein
VPARRSEQDVQRAIVQHFRLRATPDLYWFYPANGGARAAVEGAILKVCGVRAGRPHLICIKDGRTFGLELKTAHAASAKPSVSPVTKCAKRALKSLLSSDWMTRSRSWSVGIYCWGQSNDRP